MNTAKTTKLINAAKLKFGDVVAITDSHLIIRRDRPVFEDTPYMTIAYHFDEGGEVQFYWGHYDQTHIQALDDIRERSER